MIYNYECQNCKKEQEKIHKLAETNQEPCEACNAPPEKLKRLISTTSKGAHSSWSSWTNGLD